MRFYTLTAAPGLSLGFQCKPAAAHARPAGTQVAEPRGMRTILLSLVVVVLGLAASGCGGCFSRSTNAVTIDKPRGCLDLQVVREAKHCGGTGGTADLVLQGYNLCHVPLEWPGADPVQSSTADFQLPLPVEMTGAQTVKFKLGSEELLASFTVPG